MVVRADLHLLFSRDSRHAILSQFLVSMVNLYLEKSRGTIDWVWDPIKGKRIASVNQPFDIGLNIV